MYRTSPWAKYCHVLRHFRHLPLVLTAFQVTAIIQQHSPEPAASYLRASFVLSSKNIT